MGKFAVAFLINTLNINSQPTNLQSTKITTYCNDYAYIFNNTGTYLNKYLILHAEYRTNF